MTETRTKTALLRPPIVAVLGHVDHGKTTLLDVIRNTQVARKEFGGITQHIGAYQVVVATTEGEKKITFIDTPGHEAFSKMRSYGAQVTDLVVLVVSAVDGVQPQTEESINHIKKANVPFLVAATKMDLPGASLERVKKQLAKIGVLTEGYGGEIVVVPVSAVKKTGIKELLEMILLIAEMKGLKGGINDPFEAVIIEAKLDNQKGPLATILVKKGTIAQGEEVYLGLEKIRVRAMFDENNQVVAKAEPAKPIVMLGFNQVPPVGAILTKEKRENKMIGLDQLLSKKAKPNTEKTLKIILKADTIGSLEAILANFNPEVDILTVGLGAVSEADILQARDNQALVVGFNVKINKKVKQLALTEKVLVKNYHIIYELFKEIDEVVGFLKEAGQEEILGKAAIIAQFPTKDGRVAGVKVLSGRISQGDQIKLVRDKTEIGSGRILSLRQGKEEVTKVEQGEECGARLSSNLDFRLTDMILSVRVREIKLR